MNQLESLAIEIVMIAAFVGAAALIANLLLSRFRTVVSTNELHVVQHVRKTVVYGKDQPGGNVYYHWPAWVPRFGVRVTTLPSSVFQLKLDNYAAYDKGRVPFILDVIGFFRIVDCSSASARVNDLKDLREQLDGILKGAMRSILASSEIEEILEGRSTFGERFTEAVDTQLSQWGVSTVKAIELMDIRDAADSKVIANIMAKNQSRIEKESRIAVATNHQAAEIAEIEAKQAVSVQQQMQLEIVGKRTADQEKTVGIQKQLAQQEIYQHQKETNEKEMEAKRVLQVRAAEIERDAQATAAEQTKLVMIAQAEGAKQKQILEAEAAQQKLTLEAEGALQAALKAAEGREAQGAAEGKAQTAIAMAPVNAQIALADKIGADAGYQNYLVTIRRVEAEQAIGVEAAKALEAAEIKVITTTGTPMTGLKSVMDVFTPAGATQVGASLEALAQTDIGARITNVLKGITTPPSGHTTS